MKYDNINISKISYYKMIDAHAVTEDFTRFVDVFITYWNKEFKLPVDYVVKLGVYNKDRFETKEIRLKDYRSLKTLVSMWMQ